MVSRSYNCANTHRVGFVRSMRGGAGVALLAALGVLVMVPSSALAAIGANGIFGGTGIEGGLLASGVAINQQGTGGASAGDVYAADLANNRIQQFSASGEFIRTFGRGVGGPGVDICEEAASCVAGEASTAAGALYQPGEIAIDQQTGTIYVVPNRDDQGHPNNNRVDVFSATGIFEGAFGWDVKASGGAEELQFCTTAGGCQAASMGHGAGQLQDSNFHIAVSPVSGHVFVSTVDFGSVIEIYTNEYAPVIEAGNVVGVSFVRKLKGAGGSLGVNASGTLFAQVQVKDFGGTRSNINRFDAEGNPLGVFAEVSANTVKVNSANGNVLAVVNRQSPVGGNEYQIDEYSPSGVKLTSYLVGGQAWQIFGIAQNETTGTIYFGNRIILPNGERSGIVTIGEVEPPTASINPVTNFTGTTAQFSGSANPKGFYATYQFEYSIDGQNWKPVNPEGKLPDDSVDHSATGEATGLEGSTEYHVRLTATKAFNSASASAETTFTTLPEKPSVEGPPTFTHVDDDEATLEAEVNPQNEEVSYRFECVDDAAFEAGGFAEAFEVPQGGATLGAAPKALPVAQTVKGLSPGTTYHCRLTASNQAGSTTSSEATFTTYLTQSVGLPDGRAYEQATPVDKNGADAAGGENLLRTAPNGGSISYLVPGGGSAEGGGSQAFPSYAAQRSSNGWSSYAFLPSNVFGEQARVTGWSADLKRDYVLTWNSGTAATFYEKNLESGAMTQIASGLEPIDGALYADESSNGSRVLFESQTALTKGAIEGVWNLYAWDRAGGPLSLVDVLPNGSTPTFGAFAGPFAYFPSEEPKTGGANAKAYTTALHVLSDDGSKAIFTTSTANQLYVRVGIGTPGATTKQVSASQRTPKDPHGPKKAAFMEATPDGRYVFFGSAEELTNDANTGSEDLGKDLYRYDTETGQLIDLAVDPTNVNGAEVLGVLGASPDSSYVYFAAMGVLADGATKSPAGKANLYLWHEGSISFIARISSASNGSGDGANWIPIPDNAHGASRSARVSANGTLMFTSQASPTSYDSAGNLEVYRYNTEEGLQCVSCNPTGAAPHGSAALNSIRPGAFGNPPKPNFAVTRNLSANGKRVFFETPEKLVPSDTNGNNGCPLLTSGSGGYACRDVYEWEAKGEGSCESEAQNGGCIYLISTGESDEASYFADASESGDDVLFFTRQALLRQDTDQLQDIYDARVDGGIASQNEAPPTPCQGEAACRPSVTTAPQGQSAGSASFSGPGNPKPVHRKAKKHKHAKKKHKHAKKSKKHAKARSHR